MDSADTGAVTSDLADLARDRLADLDEMTGEDMAGMLARIIPATPGQRVAVAAFNSSV